MPTLTPNYVIESYYKDWCTDSLYVSVHGFGRISADDWYHQLWFFLVHGYRVIRTLSPWARPLTHTGRLPRYGPFGMGPIPGALTAQLDRDNDIHGCHSTGAAM